MKAKEIVKIILKNLMAGVVAYLAYEGLKNVARKADEAITRWAEKDADDEYDDYDEDHDDEYDGEDGCDGCGCGCDCHGHNVRRRCTQYCPADAFYDGANYMHNMTLETIDVLMDGMEGVFAMPEESD